MRNRPWLVINFKMNPVSFECTRCHETYPMPFHCPLSFVTAIGKAFSNLHKSCKIHLIQENKEPPFFGIHPGTVMQMENEKGSEKESCQHNVLFKSPFKYCEKCGEILARIL